MYEAITKQTQTVLMELLDQAKLKRGALLVLGCSSSEMVGQRIGKGSSMEAAQAAFRACTLCCRSGASTWLSSAASI